MSIVSHCRIQNIINRNAFWVVLPVLLIFVLGFNSCLSRAKGQYSNLRCQPGMGFVNGEPDFGINLKINVKNTGEEGDIKILAALSTSEGEWKREQNLGFKKGESKELTYFFSEPTVNVDPEGLQCRIKLSPSAE